MLALMHAHEQWAATRPDLFHPDVCEALTRLHSGAPSHTYLFTRQAIERAFKRNMDDIFSSFETAPVASGSIAQVHRGVLNDGGSFGSKYKPVTVVAVKVQSSQFPWSIIHNKRTSS